MVDVGPLRWSSDDAVELAVALGGIVATDTIQKGAVKVADAVNIEGTERNINLLTAALAEVGNGVVNKRFRGSVAGPLTSKHLSLLFTVSAADSLSDVVSDVVKDTFSPSTPDVTSAMTSRRTITESAGQNVSSAVAREEKKLKLAGQR